MIHCLKTFVVQFTIVPKRFFNYFQNKFMKRDTTLVFSLFFILGMIVFIPAYGDHPEVTIETAAGSGAPGCEQTDEGCYLPTTVTVFVDGVVIMSNTDTAAHTFTAGTPADGPSGEFDTGLLMGGNSFEYSPDTEGEIPYFCMVHPWMVGVILVEEAGSEGTEEKHDKDEEHGEHEETEKSEEHEETTTMIKGMSEDGSVNIDIMTTDPTMDEKMTIIVEFSNASGEEQKHMNYDILATQNGDQVLLDEDVHLMEANAKHITSPLGSSDPVDVQITLHGIGMSEPFTGPKGDIVQFNVVPEFGAIAMIVLGISIASVVILSTKTKMIPRF